MTVCSIPDCGRVTRPYGRGWCTMHYRRWQRHGNPLTVLQAPKGAATAFIVKACAYDGDDCLIWPYGQSAYGYGWYGQRGQGGNNAHHYVCETVYGSPSTEMHAAHECGNRLCVNPKHLAWKTPIENEADKERHGTKMKGERHHMAKLSASDVAKIRQQIGRPSPAVAKEFGVAKSTVLRIWSGKIWGGS